MKQLKTLFALLLIATSLHATNPDTLLGDSFQCRTFHMGSDYSGEVRSTLTTKLPLLDSKRAILYIHGYSDYFFQSEMAQRFHDSSYNFYAIDLRKYGRSYDPSQRLFEVRDLREYFADIDSALMVVRGQGAKEVILMGHSTGGLIASYYCGSRQSAPPVEGLILNSPFLDMNLSPFMEDFATPIASFVGSFLPDIELYNDTSTAYLESLLSDHHGEWQFNTTLKPFVAPPTTAGWIHAIHEGHKSVQRGYDLEIPILLMYSDKSVKATEWSPEHQISDSVLDVEDIKKYGARLGQSVTHAQIKDGMHDLILSSYEVREQAYREIFEWLSEVSE